MVKHQHIDRASGFFFATGAIISKLQYMPFVLSSFAMLISLVCYFVAYTLHYISSHLYPEQDNFEFDEWYSFAQFKDQQKIAALLGIVGSIFTLVSLYVPIFIIPASICFALSSVVIAISEFNKWNNPPINDPKYSAKQQRSSVIYSISGCLLSLTIAAATTVIFIVPPFTVLILFIAVPFATIAIVAHIASWIHIQFGDHPTKQLKKDVNSALTSLGKGCYYVETSLGIPYHTAQIFKSYEPKQEEFELDNCQQPTGSVNN